MILNVLVSQFAFLVKDGLSSSSGSLWRTCTILALAWKYVLLGMHMFSIWANHWNKYHWNK